MPDIRTHQHKGSARPLTYPCAHNRGSLAPSIHSPTHAQTEETGHREKLKGLLFLTMPLGLDILFRISNSDAGLLMILEMVFFTEAMVSDCAQSETRGEGQRETFIRGHEQGLARGCRQESNHGQQAPLLQTDSLRPCPFNRHNPGHNEAGHGSRERSDSIREIATIWCTQLASISPIACHTPLHLPRCSR